MAKKPQKPSIDEKDTAERLIAAAKVIFAEKGYAGATVKEIADAAGVNVSLISYHFKGKEGLLQACLEKFGRERLQDTELFLQAPENKEDFKAKLRLWMGQFLRCQAEDVNVCTILHRENLIENKFLWELFQGTFLKTFEAVVKFFESGRKRGLVRKEIDPEIAANVIFGALVHCGKNQKAQQKISGISIADEKYRNSVAEQSINILLHGIMKENA